MEQVFGNVALACGLIIALGAIVQLTGIVSEESIIKAVLNRVPKGTEEINKKLVEAKWEIAIRLFFIDGLETFVGGK